MMADAMRLVRASRGALRPEADDSVALSDRLLPITDALHEDVVVQRLPALVDDNDRGRAVQPLLDAVEQIHHRRRARGGIVQNLGEVETQGTGSLGRGCPQRRRPPWRCIVEQPSPLSGTVPRRQPGREVACGRSPAAAEQLHEVAQAAIGGAAGRSSLPRPGRWRPCPPLRGAGPEPEMSLAVQSIRKRWLAGVSGRSSGLNPVGSPGRSTE